MTTPRRRAAPIPKPRFTLGILYVMAFFFVYCFALAGPALWNVLQTVPPGPETSRVKPARGDPLGKRSAAVVESSFRSLR